MKVLVITAGYKPAWIYGGPTYSVSALCEALVQSGTEVTVLTTNANGKNDFKIKNDDTNTIEGVNVISCRRVTGDPTSVSFSHTRKLIKIISEYDLVHINGWWNWVAIVSLMICKLRRKAHVLSPRGALSEYTFQTKHSKRIKKLLHSWLFKYLLKGTIIHVTSHEEMEKCKAVIPDARFVSIPNLVDLPTTQMTRHEKEDGLHIIFLGRIDPVKNIELLIDALNVVSFEYRLTLTGEGEPHYVGKIRERIKQNYRMQLKESIVGKEKFEMLAQADLLVLLSHSENFGNVVIEALSQGTAVLVSKNVGAAGFVQEHNLGWVIQPDLKECIETLEKINNDQGRFEEIKVIAPGIIKKEFSPSELVNRYMEECYALVNKNVSQTKRIAETV